MARNKYKKEKLFNAYHFTIICSHGGTNFILSFVNFFFMFFFKVEDKNAFSTSFLCSMEFFVSDGAEHVIKTNLWNVM